MKIHENEEAAKKAIDQYKAAIESLRATTGVREHISADFAPEVLLVAEYRDAEGEVRELIYSA